MQRGYKLLGAKALFFTLFSLYIEKHNFINGCRDDHGFGIFLLHFIPVRYQNLLFIVPFAVHDHI